MINVLHGITRGGVLSADGFWIPEGPGKWSRPLRFLKNDRGWVELMRLNPGVKIGLHRHTGEVHALNLAGQRRLCTGETIGPGDYVYEAAGNVDLWEAIGDTSVVVMVIVMGAVEYLSQDRTVTRRITAAERIADYRRYCVDTRIEPQILVKQ